ncbi:protein zwilch homolog isoform X2, partial [Podarcis lilfordi]
TAEKKGHMFVELKRVKRKEIHLWMHNPLKENNVFQLPIRTTFVKEFYPNANPQVWREEISSGQGEKKVKTMWQVSTTVPAEHMSSSTAGILDDTEDGGSKEMCFITFTECSQVYFT